VDAMPDTALLVQVMDETAMWEATRELRQATDGWLAVGPGDRVLDVGCGPGDVTRALAGMVGPEGEVVGIDASTVMVTEARRRADRTGLPVRFAVGDAYALDLDDATFDAVRSERVLQWLHDPQQAIDEMVRVTGPGGRVAVIDSDWGTFALYHPDVELTDRITRFFLHERRAQRIGRELRARFRWAGLEGVVVRAVTQVFAEWDHTARSLPPGFPPLRAFLPDVVGAGALSPQEAERWVAALEEAARQGEFFASLTMYAATGRKPADG
ncbi:MAG: methyltransferase domain-containing protein, partial [Acidimicrobiales bacterium]